jgi:hypothetical protein
MKKLFLYSTFLFLFPFPVAVAQEMSDLQIKELLAAYKKDIRGPYKDIRWFCTDGSIRAPKDPCPEEIGPGLQHARYKDAVVELAKGNHLFWGQILAYTDKDEFWDTEHNHSRLKQYQLEKYLRAVDDGWILRKGQYYRGSVQAEDEETWGIEFYKWLLAQDKPLVQNYFLIRESLKDIPHKGDDNLAQEIRSTSKMISDLYTPFMDLRVKIHSQPEYGDLEKVRNFRTGNAPKLTPGLLSQFYGLIKAMEAFYRPMDIRDLREKASLLKDTPLGKVLEQYIAKNAKTNDPALLVPETAQLLETIRTDLLKEKRPLARLQLLDISLKLEELVFKTAPNWHPATLEGLLEKICYLGMATTGAGYLEKHEWEQIQGDLAAYHAPSMTLPELNSILETARSQVEWSASMVKANYAEVVERYTSFEPLAYGFIDDKIRGGIALHLGESVGELGDYIAKESSLSNKVLDIPNQSSLRGLNPGYALGELVVINGPSDGIEVSPNKIYIFQRPPSDLKPVAGIATVSEGNMVSHVQLLARNLGIPNAALSDRNLESLQKYHGQKVFYAVSNKGNVLLKMETQMDQGERALFSKKERSSEKIAVPVQNIRLDENKILDLRYVDAQASGKLCGPKAANLGQLKKMFPDKVVEGLVVPFGIFRSHMDQPMAGRTGTYWQFLNEMFQTAEQMGKQGISEGEVENFQLHQLEILREAIRKMELRPAFVAQLEKEFQTVLGKDLGAVPVFLRSDTNMEDLKDFSGAGLNLTLFNVVDRDKILTGIKEVWASPYTERSFKWRQKYLSNPENVFPSILIIPSVDVDYSGVMITKGIGSGNEKDLTIAFSRGAGGAVDGQSAESYLVKEGGGLRLLAPAREAYHNTLPVTGGTGKKQATFEEPILNEQNINEMRELARTIRETMPKATGSEYRGAYDVELGFQKNKLWLFQIRPFVENKKALGSVYLESITPQVDPTKKISLSNKIPK